MAILNIRDVSIAFGGPHLLDAVNIQIHSGDRICLLGRNGAGKSTLMKMIHGIIEPDSGEIIREKNTSTSFLPQDVPADITGSVYDIIAQGIASFEDFNAHLSSREEQKHRLEIEKVISVMSLDPALRFEGLSAGMKRRVLLGRALAKAPDILLLDEPTNHLDLNSIQWLEDFLRSFEKTLVFVTHDRVFLQKVATRIVELDRGMLYDWKCDYRTYLKRKDEQLEAEEQQNANFDKKLAQEEAWVRRGIKARRTRNEGRVRALEEMRKIRAARREVQGNVSMNISQAGRPGKIVIEAEEISFGYGSANIIRNFSTLIQRGDRIGIIGPNGCGKSTLIRLLLGELEPLEGRVKTGVRLETAYFDQLKDKLKDDLTVRENISEAGEYVDFNGKSRHVIGYLQDFLFTPDRVTVKAGVLSGGERNRLMLAKLFTQPVNLLVFDEPTNDLDLETVELLEEVLNEYTGTLLLVSHDRAFLNNVVTSTIVFEGDGTVKEYAGGYDDWLMQRKEAPKKKTQKPAQNNPAGTPEKKKLTFKEKNELAGLPKILEEKENHKDELFRLMSDPSVYKENGNRVADIKQELSELEQELGELYTRWEELEAKRTDG